MFYFVSLTGNFNGNATDDLFSSDGTQYPSTLTEEEIYDVGLTWMTSESDTLFTYGIDSLLTTNWLN